MNTPHNNISNSVIKSKKTKASMEYTNVIRKMAWKYHKTTGIDYDELFAEASMAYCVALNTYRPDNASKTSLCSYIWKNMDNFLKDFVHKEIRYKMHCMTPFGDDLPEPSGFTLMPEMDSLEEIYGRLDTDGKMVAHITIREWESLAHLPPKIARGKIIDLLRQSMGWSWPRIWRSIKAVKEALNESTVLCILN